MLNTTTKNQPKVMQNVEVDNNKITRAIKIPGEVGEFYCRGNKQF